MRQWIHHVSLVDNLSSSINDFKYENKAGVAHTSNPLEAFDCSSLVVPKTTHLVKSTLQSYVDEWEELDSRIISNDTPPEICASKGIRTKGRKKRRRYSEDSNIDDDELGNEEVESAGAGQDFDWGGHKRIRMPDFFDYTSQRSPPNPSAFTPAENSERRQVVSLDDPSQKIDYEEELWNIFDKVPRQREIDSCVYQGSLCRNLLLLKEEIEKECVDYSRLDAHALARLRKRERHNWPRISNSVKCESVYGTTIRMEFWRKHVGRGSKSDPNRCEMEFSSTQTLLEVHNAISQFAGDDLFHKGTQMKAKASISRTTEASIQPGCGYFFIEGTFYTIGNIDYVTPILEWLNEDLNQVSGNVANDRSRKQYLGIQDSVLKQVRMEDVELGDIVMRLAHRYVHVYNGDCETALFFSDITVRMKSENMVNETFPIVHDIWTNANASLVHGTCICQGCDHCPAVVMTIEDEMTNGGPTLLCSSCYRKLHYGKDGCELKYTNFRVIPLAVLQNLKELSDGHEVNSALF